ncbi:MAG: YdcF family protein [Pseudomonadota bacterium]
MFFVLAKVGWALIKPSSLIAALIIGGLLLSLAQRWRRTARGAVALGLALYLAAGLTPLATIVIAPLEDRIRPADLTAIKAPSIAGIIVLGGGEDGAIARARGQLALNEAGERITAGLELAYRFPTAKLVFSGGIGALIPRGPPGARAVAQFWRATGIAPARVLVERRSRDTHENAVMSAALLRPKPQQRWLLVTSAFHMPRASALFRRAGFRVLPWPVDYRSDGPQRAWRNPSSVPRGLEQLDLATKEWLGLLVYRLVGRTDALFPK